MPRLDFYADSKPFVKVHLGESAISIGRAADCDVQLLHGRVSRHHARILPVEGGFAIEDTSTNGTRINAEMLEGRARLQPGDRIYIESHAVVYHQDDDAPTEPVQEDPTAYC